MLGGTNVPWSDVSCNPSHRNNLGLLGIVVAAFDIVVLDHLLKHVNLLLQLLVDFIGTVKLALGFCDDTIGLS